MSQPVSVIRTGTANLASVLAALERAGARPTLTDSADEVSSADRVVLPGVGAFGAAMPLLREHGLDAALVARVREGRPLLCICLGMQLLFEGSEESPGVPGLGLIEGQVTRFQGRGLRVPQLGWNQLTAGPQCQLLSDGYVYFANSFRVEHPPHGFHVALSDHGGHFVAAIERGPLLACQFHPELSGAFGQVLLRRWLDAGERPC